MMSATANAELLELRAEVRRLERQLEAEQGANAKLAEATEEFVRGLAHDVKNPLAAIKLSVQGLKRALDRNSAIEPDYIRERLDRIERSLGQTLELIAAARAQGNSGPARRPPAQREVVDLVALVRAEVEEVKKAAGEKRLRLRCELPALLGTWDQQQVRRATRHLLDNAIKFSPEGQPVQITVRRLPDGPAEITVRDHGIGIPARDLPHVSERFYRGENVLGRFKGAGIGLFEAKQAMEAHDGTLTAESSEGIGSVFIVRLPLN